ncbi:MAG: sugar transferase [Candidatus Margulisiibacteriota bacterium]
MSTFYRRIGKRGLDIFASFLGVICLLPLFLIIAIIIKTTSKGPVFFIQERVGRDFQPFNMVKFRSMVVNDNTKHSLVTSSGDQRVTRIGQILRRYKLDELPQLLNVLNGTMSLVGPRPEVSRYIKYYKSEYEIILSVKPGITDNASIEFKKEEEILAQYDEKERAYIEKIMPQKMKLYNDYIKNITLLSDIKLIFKTIF